MSVFLCAISSQPCQQPVTTKNGHIFERRLIEKYIQNAGVDPVTNERLAIEDLIELKVQPVLDSLAPHPPGQQGIPALLKLVQGEWDALMLEFYTLRQKLTVTQQEFSHSLYRYDASCRVIARLLEECDQYKKELIQLKAQPFNSLSAPILTNSSSLPSTNIETNLNVHGMDIDVQSGYPGLSKEMQERIDAMKMTLSTIRATRKIPASVSSRDAISTLKLLESYPLHSSSIPGILCVDIHPKNTHLIATGGSDHHVVLFDRIQGKKLGIINDPNCTGHQSPIIAIRFHPEEDNIVTCSEDGTVIYWALKNNTIHLDGTPVDSTLANISTSSIPNMPTFDQWTKIAELKCHTQTVTSLDLHPIGNLVLTSSKDRTFALYDLVKLQIIVHHRDPMHMEMPVTVAKFHPDGEIMATGGQDNHIQVWDVKSQEHMVTFEGHTAAVTDLCFSENGYTLASASADHTILLWDLVQLSTYKKIQLDVVASKLKFDLSGRFLAAACGDQVLIFTGKNLDLMTTLDENSKLVTDIAWGEDAKWITATSMDRSLKLWTV